MLNQLKKEMQTQQLKGLPFTLSANVIWITISIIYSLNIDLSFKNLLTFCVSSIMLPIALLIAKRLKINIFAKDHPLTALGMTFTMNQMLYLFIVMLLMNRQPELMLISYAIVYAAHLFPYHWLYDSKTYQWGSVILSISSLIIYLMTNHFILSIYMVAFMGIFNYFLYRETKQLC